MLPRLCVALVLAAAAPLAAAAAEAETRGSNPFASRDFLAIVALAVLLALAYAVWRKKPDLSKYLYTAVGPVPTILFVVLSFCFLGWVTAHRPRVLVLHSYAEDFSWVRDINVGIGWELDKKAYFVREHYMDTKRNPSEDYKRRAGQHARRLIESWEPNVVIAVDDNAQKFAAVEFINHPKINIVYTGVNSRPEDYGFDGADNVTGVLERIPFAALKEALMKVMPCPERPTEGSKCRVIHLSDASPTSTYIHQELDEFDWAPIELVRHQKIETFDEWKRAVLETEGEADFLMITHYHTLRTAEAMDAPVQKPESVMEWTIANAPIPDIGCWGFFVEDGGMLALGVSPFDSGLKAAKMATEIIDRGTRPSQIPPLVPSNYLLYVREPRLVEEGVDLPEIYRAFASATNNYYVAEEGAGP